MPSHALGRAVGVKDRRAAGTALGVGLARATPAGERRWWGAEERRRLIPHSVPSLRSGFRIEEPGTDPREYRGPRRPWNQAENKTALKRRFRVNSPPRACPGAQPGPLQGRERSRPRGFPLRASCRQEAPQAPGTSSPRSPRAF